MTDPSVLERIGLRAGEPVRFRRTGTRGWSAGRVAGVVADGNITVHDANGRLRTLHPTVVEVRRPGQRGRLRWHALCDVAITWEQLLLW